MKLKSILIISLFLALPYFAQAQNPNKAKYYFDITRPNCCVLTDAKWQQIAAKLRKSGIPTFLGLYDVQNYENWKSVKLRRTTVEEGWLILGPFASEAAALAALRKLPKLLPKGYDTFNGVEPGPTASPQTWQVGQYQINGFKTSSPVAVQKSNIERKSGVIEGIIVEVDIGASGYAITVESDGIKYSVYMTGNNLRGANSVVGDVTTVGNRVRITYKSKRKTGDIYYDLGATRVVQVKKSRK